MNNCNCNRICDCNSCDKPKCGCRKPMLEVSAEPTDVAILKFNFGGVTTRFDARNTIEQTQTDTTLSADTANRLLKYMAERHTDTISAKELGAIIHLADLGDVDAKNVEDGSILVYRKESGCADGCESKSNAFTGYNALDDDNIETSLQYVAGFDENGHLETLGTPANASQYYMLGWNAGEKVSYSQPQVVTTVPTDTDGKVWRLYIDPETKQIVAHKEDA